MGGFLHLYRFCQRNLFYPQILLAASLCLFATPRARAIDRTACTRATMLALEGGNLSAWEAKRLENILATHPTDIGSRIKLLGYYYLKAHTSEEALVSRQEHILWCMENCPETAIVGTPYVSLDPNIDKHAHEKARLLWERHLRLDKTNTALLANAARFFSIDEPDLSAEYLLKAQVLDPLEPEWPERLGRLYLAQGINEVLPERRKDLMNLALIQLEQAVGLIQDPIFQLGLFADLAKVSFEAGDMDKAGFYAKELLAYSRQTGGDWFYGKAIHIGNLILGRIALQSGNITQAKFYLLRSTQIPSSPHLRSFGPNMALADELLVYGEDEAVIEYLRQCGKFWKQQVLNRWIEKIKAGKRPDFGLSLYR